MAGVDLASGRPQGKKTATLRRPKRRVGIRIDMTPMVDIAFLLLIFYMVTTIFMQPQAMEISLPPDKEKSVAIKESNLLIFRVDSIVLVDDEHAHREVAERDCEPDFGAVVLAAAYDLDGVE